MANIELHVHPFLGKNTLVDVVQAMRNNDLDVLALESLDSSLFPHVLEEAKQIYTHLQSDHSGIKLPDGRYLLNAREYNTKENLHVLTVGYSMNKATPETEIRKVIDKGLAHKALVILDHPFVDNAKTNTAGHISGELEQELGKICREYSGQIALEWNAYCVPWVRCGLKHVLNLAGFGIKYHNVNKKAEELSAKLKEQGYNVPVVADTDLHARNRRLLQMMGKARIITNIEGETPAQVVSSIRSNIFKGDYKNINEKSVPFFSHLLSAFCLPIMFPKYFPKPRA
jgi:hypothetical protein